MGPVLMSSEVVLPPEFLSADIASERGQPCMDSLVMLEALPGSKFRLTKLTFEGFFQSMTFNVKI